MLSSKESVEAVSLQRQASWALGQAWKQKDTAPRSPPLLHTAPVCSCYGINHVPQNSSVETLTPGTSECGVIWRQDPFRGNQVATWSSGWAAIQYDWCPSKKRRLGHSPIGREDRAKTLEGGRQLQAKRDLSRNQPC